jgi:hypothetical protein
MRRGCGAFQGLDTSGHYRKVDRAQDRLRKHEKDVMLQELRYVEEFSILLFGEKNEEHAQEQLLAASREGNPVYHCQKCAKLPYSTKMRTAFWF